MSIKAEPTFSLKDQLFNAESVGELSAAIAKAQPRFARADFERAVLARFAGLELKDRIRWIVTVLEKHLPADYSKALDILGRSLPEPLDPNKSDDDFGKFIWVVPGEYVARHGCTRQYLDDSLSFLREATKRFSSEGAIRPFLRDFPEQTLSFVHECADDPNYHVRRLASEGIRPFLPWAERVELPVDTVIGVLDHLHADNTRYVTRSVANTLNDLSRIDADAVLTALERWHRQQTQQADELKWMTRHALRTLLREDHPEALAFLGYPAAPKYRMSGLQTSNRVKVGEVFEWHCTLTSVIAQKLKITLRIHYLKANGKHSAKTFAVKETSFRKGESIEVSKRVPFRPVTTRTLYTGTHYAQLLVNGTSRQKRRFELVE